MPTEPTVYVIDDEPDICKVLSDILEGAHIKVKTYTSPREFMLTYSPDNPGCLLLDIGMPDINGLELMEAIIARGNRTPVIFLTGNATVANAVEMLKAGAVDFIEKPPKVDVILSCVRKALEIDVHRRHEQLQFSNINQRLKLLTAREREVMTWITVGKSNKMIALILDISSRTVEIHRAKILDKMQAASVAELVKMDLMVKEYMSVAGRESRSH
ncbi:MAG: two-component system response regulator FixJ [Gammaproteobacteria bacterium]|jgi:two-component system response regulator FixJ|tara:strand:- start:11273 stop:11917 length:645 start_codon:yes stop_codon:yes gene_type:complete